MATPSAESFIAAATAVAETPAEAAPEAVESVAPVAEVSEAPATETIPPGKEPAKAAPVETKDLAQEKPASRVEKSLADVAREKAALRAEREQLKEYKALADAAKSKNAMQVLAAAGIKWKDAAMQVLEGKSEPDEPASKAEPDERDRRLAAIEQELQSTKAAAMRNNLMGQLKEKTKDARFKHIAAFEAEHEAISFIEKYFNETGELPGSDLDETMEIALEAVEAQYNKIADRWKKVLTPGASPATVAGSKPAVPAAGAVSQQAARTLTNNVGSGPAPVPGETRQPKTDEDYIRAAIELATAQ